MELENPGMCPVIIAAKLNAEDCDVVCVVGNEAPPELSKVLSEYRTFDKAFDSELSCFKPSNFDKLVVYSPVGELTDYDDVRCYQEAAAKAIQRAIKAGCSKPLLLLPGAEKYADLSALLGALRELYVPIQLREDVPSKKQRVENLHVMCQKKNDGCNAIKLALLLDSGRQVARDIGIGDPERMTPINVESYVRKAFTTIKIDVVSDVSVLIKEYPLFAAVNRAANSVNRHQGRIIFLEYKPPSPAKKTLLLVGKGVTYDTGGADIKAGGVMAGMSRDKCGAAAVAGFMKVVEKEKPSNIHVIAALCMVRNSVGEEGYVADEVITSRAGVRVRIGNTDAEGRMCMADALCKMKELAKDLPDPHLFTIATLTGHACLTVGRGYSIVMDNSVARFARHAQKLKTIGDEIGDPFEISTLRADDFSFNSPHVIGEDIVQSNNLPSVRTPRGHQVGASFMIIASGLDKHGLKSTKPIKYSHLDIAASAGEYPEVPTGAPIVALVKTHLITDKITEY